VRSPIPGQENQIVLHKCRNWAAQVGEIKISDDGLNPVISLHIVGVLANAQSFDSYGTRIQKARSLLYEQLGIEEDDGLLPPCYEMLWRGTMRTCEILFRNVRELVLDSFRAQDLWRLVIDFPFDREGYTPKDDRAWVQEFQDTGESSHGLVWLPSFFTPRTLEDLGCSVLLDHVLSGNNLSQNGSHLSQIEREQARVLLQNQRDQMQQRLRNYMLAAYGVSTMYREGIDTSHDLDEHFLSLNHTLTLQPPVGANLKDALEHLLAQALAHQFPAHPDFGVAEVRRPSLRRVLDVIRHATQTRDGRVEVERSCREEVRRIAVPLQLGDMGETHFVWRDEWKSRFLRKQAEAGVTSLTVRRLRAWIDQPAAMGLPRDIQNLVILSFAWQCDLGVYLYGNPIEPQLENLDDELELRQQPLPPEDLWHEATQRAEAILGVGATPLLTAAGVAKFVAVVQVEAGSHRPAVDQYCQALRQRLHSLGIDASKTPRLQTAQASLTLLHGLAGADKDAVVGVVAKAHVATSGPAMGEIMKKAATLSSSLETTAWEVFEKLAQLPAERVPQARTMVETVRDTLTRDEHVVQLSSALKEAQTAALELLTSLVTSPYKQRPGIRL
jgi:hypothetical protein